jgi:hypothetical protein
LSAVFKESVRFGGGKWALWKIVRNLGFRWRRSEIRRKVLIERDDTLPTRLAYLRTISH